MSCESSERDYIPCESSQRDYIHMGKSIIWDCFMEEAALSSLRGHRRMHRDLPPLLEEAVVLS